nr:hypothetical protein [uncultured Gellertiella sp.]
MNISKDLFMAVLAMDSYNRGYNASVGTAADGLGSQAGLKVGSASIMLSSDSSSSSAGFYAVAYNWNGQTIISYRGTDNLVQLQNFNPLSSVPGSDAWNGYGTGAGNPLATQAVLAAEFFQRATGTDATAPSNANTIVIGHSLGGGLRGGSVCLNSSGCLAKWISASIMLPPSSVAAR